MLGARGLVTFARRLLANIPKQPLLYPNTLNSPTQTGTKVPSIPQEIANDWTTGLE